MLPSDVRVGWTYIIDLPDGERLCQVIEWCGVKEAKRLSVVCLGTGVPYTVTAGMVVRPRRRGDKPHKAAKDKWARIAGAYRKAAGSDH